MVASVSEDASSIEILTRKGDPVTVATADVIAGKVFGDDPVSGA